MSNETKIIPVELSDGTIIKVEATQIGEQKVAFQSRSFREVSSVVKSITQEISGMLQDIHKEVQPEKVSVKIGLEIAIESGQLTALIAKGSGKANLEITMEWN